MSTSDAGDHSQFDREEYGCLKFPYRLPWYQSNLESTNLENTLCEMHIPQNVLQSHGLKLVHDGRASWDLKNYDSGIVLDPLFLGLVHLNLKL